jgi:hypothetical protein
MQTINLMLCMCVLIVTGRKHAEGFIAPLAANLQQILLQPRPITPTARQFNALNREKQHTAAQSIQMS